jgi:hypothetical protein
MYLCREFSDKKADSQFGIIDSHEVLNTCSMLTLHSLPERVKSFLDGTKSARLGTVSFLVAEGRSLRKKSRLAYHYFHAEERLIKTQRRTQFPSPKSVF